MVRDDVKNLILTNGYGNIWESPYEINANWFKLSFKQKMKDHDVQDWNSLVEKSSSGLNYRIFKDTFEMNFYLMSLSNYKCRILTVFRTQNHRLPVETGRQSSIPLNERICKLCNNGIGDGYHYILSCKSLNDQRKQYVKPYFYIRPNVIKFHSLMNYSNKLTMNKLCSFIEIITKTIKEPLNNYCPDRHFNFFLFYSHFSLQVIKCLQYMCIYFVHCVSVVSFYNVHASNSTLNVCSAINLACELEILSGKERHFITWCPHNHWQSS